MNQDDIFKKDPATELEARIVAWVLNEVSPFEAAELERLVAGDPALARFKRGIESAHALAAEAAHAPKERLELAPDRRKKLLAAIGAVEATHSPASARASDRPSIAYQATSHSNRKSQQRMFWMIGMAACATLGIFLLLQSNNQWELRQNEIRAQAEMPAVESRKKAEVDRRAAEDAMKRAKYSRLEQAKADSPGSVSVALPVARPEVETARLSTVTASSSFYRDADRTPPGDKWSKSSGHPSTALSSADSAAPVSPLESEPVELTPFSVTADSQQGYQAATTLAGSRAEPTAKTDFARALVPNVGSGIGTISGGGSAGQDANFDDAFKKPAPTGGAKTADYYFPPAPSTNVASQPGRADDLERDRGLDGGRDKNPANSPSAPIALPNFSVAANEQQKTAGSDASQTLAGNRIDTKLRDVGSAVTVVTDQFLKDVGATSNESLLQYTTGTEAGKTSNGYVDGSSGTFPDRLSSDVVDAKGANPASRAAWKQLAKEASVAQAQPAMQSTPPDQISGIRGNFAGNKHGVEQAESDRPIARTPAPIDESLRQETAAAAQPFSTFSLHVSDASFQLARAALDRGEAPDPSTIRPEEFYNAFDYGDPAPSAGEAVHCRVEQAAHPFLQQRNLVRIAMKIPATGRAASQPLHLTLLLDTSGSMERADRSAAVRRAMEVLVSLLGPADRVTLIGFARQPHLLADQLAGRDAAKLLDIVSHTPADGGTNFEEALKLAGERARAGFDPAAQNRIVVLSDGAANLGNDDPAQLAARVENLRQQGIAFDACGVGAEGLDDSVLEALTRKGDGRYYILNSAADADANFARQLAGALRPAAQNVKVQVRFNPARVRSYRLIGFEQHRLRPEDFRDDRITAAELAAEEAAVALYQVETIAEGEGELGDVFVRFRDVATAQMVERSWTLPYDPQAPAFTRATPSLQLAGVSALLAEKLRGGALASQIRLDELAPIVNALRGQYAAEPRVQDLVRMFAEARRVTGN